jgi:hypothetical protein
VDERLVRRVATLTAQGLSVPTIGERIGAGRSQVARLRAEARAAGLLPARVLPGEPSAGGAPRGISLAEEK